MHHVPTAAVLNAAAAFSKSVKPLASSTFKAASAFAEPSARRREIERQQDEKPEGAPEGDMPPGKPPGVVAAEQRFNDDTSPAGGAGTRVRSSMPAEQSLSPKASLMKKAERRRLTELAKEPTVYRMFH